MAKQLADIGVSEERAGALGDIMSSVMTTLARREGISPEEFYERLELKFVRGDVDPKTGKTDAQIGQSNARGSINLSNLVRGLRGENTVTLSNTSDATTLLHEPAHLFRELMRIQAEKFKDDTQLQADWKSIQEYGDHEQCAKGAV